MSSSDMKVFDDFIMPVISEQLPQRIAAFNEASPGIQLSSAGFVGDIFQQSFYDALHSNQRRVDPYAANGAVSAVDLTQSEHITVKVHGGFGPIRFEDKQFRILRKPTQEGVTVIAGQFVDAFIADQFNTSVAAATAAFENNALATFDESTAGVSITPLSLNQRGLNRTHALAGDRSQNFQTQIMSGAAYHQFIDEGIVNATRLFTSANILVIDILGKRTVISDVPALTADAGATAKVMVLSDGGILVDSSDMPITNIETTNGKQRIEKTWQTDYEFSIGLKGYSWDVANGGRAPLDAELETGTNWDLSANDVKFTGGLLYIADAV